MAARRPAKTKSAKTATKKAPARRKAAVKRAAPDHVAPTTDQLAELLAHAAGLSREELVARALKAFAAAHGISLPEPVAAEVTEPAKAAPAPTEKAPSAPPAPAEAHDDTPALSTGQRLYVHGIGRPPVEMIADTYVIGSGPRCDLWVNSTGIETKHLRIDRVNGKYYATDLNTEKGTVLHGERLSSAVEIKHEDTFYLAGYHRVRMYVLE